MSREIPPLHPTAARYQAMLDERGIPAQVRMLPDSTRTAAEAAKAIGVQVGQIIKSLVFLRGEHPVIVLCAGDRTVDTEKLGLIRADAKRVRELTGYAIGGIPPIGHADAEVIIDQSLDRFDEVWAAAGHPHAVFALTPDRLRRALPDGRVVEL